MQAVRHVQADPRAVDHGDILDLKLPLRAQHHHPPRPHRRQERRRPRQPADAPGWDLSTWTAPTRLRASSRSATRFNIPLVFLQDVPGFMVGSKVEHAGIIRPRGEDAPRDERGDGAQGDRRGPQGVRRGLLRDVRACRMSRTLPWPGRPRRSPVMGAGGDGGDRGAESSSAIRSRRRR